MKNHDRISFTREYCRCRKIPYRIVRNEGLTIAGYHAIYSLYNLTYAEIVRAIDDMCEYDALTTEYIRRTK